MWWQCFARGYPRDLWSDPALVRSAMANDQGFPSKRHGEGAEAGPSHQFPPRGSVFDGDVPPASHSHSAHGKDDCVEAPPHEPPQPPPTLHALRPPQPPGAGGAVVDEERASFHQPAEATPKPCTRNPTPSNRNRILCWFAPSRTPASEANFLFCGVPGPQDHPGGNPGANR